MKILIPGPRQQITFGLVMLLMVPVGVAAPTPDAPHLPQNATASEKNMQPNAHGAEKNTTGVRTLASYANSPVPMWTQAADEGQQEVAPTAVPAGQQTSTQPVGTAAAPYVKPEGVPASRPAGAAIAPAKQRRSYSFAIRVGLLIGAGIAIGTVAAASLNSPSRPH